MADWCDVDSVQRLLGTSVDFTGDPVSVDVVAAANAWARRRRLAAGYVDDPAPAPAPSADVAMGTGLYAVALWRERASTDSFQSFGDLNVFSAGTGSSTRINQLLGIGKAAVDHRPADDQVVTARHPAGFRR